MLLLANQKEAEQEQSRLSFGSLCFALPGSHCKQQLAILMSTKSEPIYFVVAVVVAVVVVHKLGPRS